MGEQGGCGAEGDGGPGGVGGGVVDIIITLGSYLVGAVIGTVLGLKYYRITRRKQGMYITAARRAG